MPRTLLGTLAADVVSEFPTPAFLLDIIPKDGSARRRITTHPFELPVDSNLYNTQGLTLSKLRFGVDRQRAASECQMSAISGAPITIAEIQSGFYRSAKYEIGICDYSAATPTRTVLLAGHVGRVRWDDQEIAIRMDLKGLLKRGQRILIENNTPNCRAIIGDHRCRLPIIEDDSVDHITVRANSTAYAVGHFIRVFQASSYNDRIFECTTAGTSAASAPTFDLTIDNTTTDGTAVFTTRDSWVREGTIASVVDLQNVTITFSDARAVDGWFGGHGEGLGLMIVRSGANINRQMEIIEFNQTGSEFKLAAPLPFALAVNDTVDIIPADNKRFETCWDKFSHGESFVGEPYKGPDGAVADIPV